MNKQALSVVSPRDVDASQTCCKVLVSTDQLHINECTNHKNIPHDNIIKRRSADVSRMIATIEEELTDSDDHEEGGPRRATVNTNGPIVVHDHDSSSPESSMYSVVAKKEGKPVESEKEGDREAPVRRLSKNSILKDINGGYDSVKRMLQRTMSVDGRNGSSARIEKPPRKYLTLNNRKSAHEEFEGEETMSLKVRRSGSTGDLKEDAYSLPDKIPTTPPPKKPGHKKSNSFINLVKSNLKF